MDRIEKMAILVLYAFFLKRMLESFYHSGNLGTAMVLLTETIIVGFVLFRRTANQISTRIGDWFLAATATSLPLLAVPGAVGDQWWNGIAVAMTFIGLGIQILSKLTLGRRFGIVAANRGICCSGPYRIVRHPIYMGYLFTHIGFLLLFPMPWNLAVFATLYLVKIPRILAEERLLSRDPAYQDYQKLVRYRLLPGLF
jgi:protein-S-isoprenylcysteine O-methyltransferase Ste14